MKQLNLNSVYLNIISVCFTTDHWAEMGRTFGNEYFQKISRCFPLPLNKCYKLFSELITESDVKRS